MTLKGCHWPLYTIKLDRCIPSELTLVNRSSKVAQQPSMLTFMKNKPELAHKLMLTLIDSNKKRKADAITASF